MRKCLLLAIVGTSALANDAPLPSKTGSVDAVPRSTIAGAFGAWMALTPDPLTRIEIDQEHVTDPRCGAATYSIVSLEELEKPLLSVVLDRHPASEAQRQCMGDLRIVEITFINAIDICYAGFDFYASSEQARARSPSATVRLARKEACVKKPGFIVRFDAGSGLLREVTVLPTHRATVNGSVIDWTPRFLDWLRQQDGNL